ncbi:MAG: DEAD/DEAH box helicase, partial [Gammaproteobacteria bacterium]
MDDFLHYQLTTYPLADTNLYKQLRDLLKLEASRQTPLRKGPFISLSRPFKQGASVADLIADRVFHPSMQSIVPYPHVRAHQEQAIRAIHKGDTTLVSTGTGSGKTESFLYPIISRCLELKDAGAPPGVVAVLIYPMNALAEDQLDRLRGLLAGFRIPFGMYVGKTPEEEAEVRAERMPAGTTNAAYQERLKQIREAGQGTTLLPPEECASRKTMRSDEGRPRILLTNVKQLELLLTRQRDTELFAGARLDFLVFDEAHTFTGAQGAETACLIRRLRAFCGHEAQDTVCVATSATIVDKENPNAAREFASRFFGVDAAAVTTVGEAYEREVWADKRSVPPAAKESAATLLAEAVAAVEDASGAKVQAVYRKLASAALPAGEWAQALYEALARNEIAWQLAELLATPTELSTLPGQLKEKVKRPVSEEEILAWLTLGAAARSGNRPLLRPVVHAFIRGISGAVVTFPAGERGPKLWLAAEDEITDSGEGAKHAHFPVTTCTTCGQHYFVSFLKDFEFTRKRPGGGEAAGEAAFWEPLAEAQGGKRVVLLDRIIGGSGDDDGDDDADDYDLAAHDRAAPLHFCRSCGAAHPDLGHRCRHCGAQGDMSTVYAVRQNKDNPGHLTSCLSCGATGRRMGSNYREPARPVRATNVADVHVLAQDMVHHSERPRLLVFCDNRQDAAFQAGWMKDHARRFRLRALMADALKGGPVSVGALARHVDDALERDESLSRVLVPEVWQVQRKEGGGGRHEQERRKFLRIQVLREVTLS